MSRPVADYVHQLGIDWLYLSPLLRAEAGSEHGYDVIDHSMVDPARGGSEGLEAVAAVADELGLGVLVDIVPNHVGVGSAMDSVWWRDLLTYGQASRYAEAFDIDWDFGDGKIRIPVLGRRGEQPDITVERRHASVRRADVSDRARHSRAGEPGDGAGTAALRAGRVAPSRCRAELPQVLRGQQSRRHQGGGAVGVRRVARRDRAVDPSRARRWVARRPSRRAGRSWRLSRHAGRGH